MSVIKLLRKLSNSEKPKTGLLIGLGLMIVLPCVWLGISRPESLFELYYIKGHTAVPIVSLLVGILMLFFGVRRLFVKQN